jgi:hypothetical protein
MTYQELPPHSRVWIYQSDRILSENEVADINARAEEFITNWNAHGAALSAAFTLVNNLFLIFFVDESKAKASGCSIDSSVGFIKHIEKRFNLDLFNRLNIAYEVDGELGIAKMAEFQQLLAEGKLTEDTVVYNNLVATKEEFEKGWRTTVSSSWHAKLLA